MGFIINFFRFLGFEKMSLSKETELESNLEFIKEIEKKIKALSKIISKYERCCKKLLKIVDNQDKTLTYINLMLRDK